MPTDAARRPGRPPLHRGRILKAAAALFMKKGFHGTSTRDIAKRARVSVGNIYNHFSNKEKLFAVLLEEYEREYFQPHQPLSRAMAESAFPMDLERLAEACRDQVDKFSDYIRLVYVNIVELDAKHVAHYFQGMRERYAAALERSGGSAAPLAGGIDPTAAMMMVTWGFFNYFTVEKLFGAKDHYRMGENEVIEHFSRIYRKGLLPGRG